MAEPSGEATIGGLGVARLIDENANPTGRGISAGMGQPALDGKSTTYSRPASLVSRTEWLN